MINDPCFEDKSSSLTLKDDEISSSTLFRILLYVRIFFFVFFNSQRFRVKCNIKLLILIRVMIYQNHIILCFSPFGNKYKEAVCSFVRSIFGIPVE